jgi:hypothetical protein
VFIFFNVKKMLHLIIEDLLICFSAVVVFIIFTDDGYILVLRRFFLSQRCATLIVFNIHS